jgi:hypothetical protein
MDLPVLAVQLGRVPMRLRRYDSIASFIVAAPAKHSLPASPAAAPARMEKLDMPLRVLLPVTRAGVNNQVKRNI